MSIQNWTRGKVLQWLGIDPSNEKVEQHTHLNFAAEVVKLSHELDLRPNDVLVLMTEQVLSDKLLQKLREDCNKVLGNPHQTIMILHGGLKMGVIHREEISNDTV